MRPWPRVSSGIEENPEYTGRAPKDFKHEGRSWSHRFANSCGDRLFFGQTTPWRQDSPGIMFSMELAEPDNYVMLSREAVVDMIGVMVEMLNLEVKVEEVP